MSDLLMTVETLRELIEANRDIIFLDVRNPMAWSTSDIQLQPSLRIATGLVDDYLDELDKSSTIVAYCT